MLIAFDDDLLTAILGTPDWERSTPIARAGEVPILNIFEPLAETACSGCSRFALDSLLEFEEAIASHRSSDEPAIEGIIEHGLIGAPAVGVIVDMLLSSERLAILLEGDAEVDIEVIVGESSSLIIAAILGVSRIVSILDKTAGILTICLLIDASIDKRPGEILGEIELTLASSAPKVGAICTIPVPSSVVT